MSCVLGEKCTVCPGSPKREDFSQGREDFPERVTLTLNVTEMVGISKAGERMEGEGRLLPSREAL